MNIVKARIQGNATVVTIPKSFNRVTAKLDSQFLVDDPAD